MSTDYRLSPSLTARLLGITMLGGAVLVVLATLLIAFADLHSIVLVVPVALVIAALVALMVWSNAWVVRLTDEGFQVRRLRNVGASSGRWREVEDMVSTEVDGVSCVVLRMRDGQTTTLPLGALHVDPNVFASTVAAHLNTAHGLRKLG